MMRTQLSSRKIIRFFNLESTPFSPCEFSRLWLLALGTYGVGDIVTTIALVRHTAKLAEANAVIQFTMTLFGLWGLIGMKLIVFVVTILISAYAASTRDQLLFYFPPVTLAIVGAFVTTFNIRLMIG